MIFMPYLVAIHVQIAVTAITEKQYQPRLKHPFSAPSMGSR